MKPYLFILSFVVVITALVLVVFSIFRGEVDQTETIIQEALASNIASDIKVEEEFVEYHVVVGTPVETELVEVANTRRMIKAHAPLRVEAIDNPDSPENQHILQQMVLNGFSHPEQR